MFLPQLWTVLVILLVFVASRVLIFRSRAKALHNLPGMRSVFAPLSRLGSLLPTSRFNPGLDWHFLWRNKVYSKYGADTISVLPYLSGRPFLYTCSLEVARQVLSPKGPFEKTPEFTRILLLWGKNIFATDGDEWKRHRRIVAPGFHSDTNRLVWEQTALIYREMTEAEGWDSMNQMILSSVNDYCSKFTLMVISRCAFGHHLSWQTPQGPTAGMPHVKAFSLVSTSPVVRLVVPRWMYKLPIKKLQNIELAYTTLAAFIQNLIDTRKQEILANCDQVQRDVFSCMVRASEAEGKLAFTDDELTGNTFFMLFAGHHTTARIMDATLGFLALYEDIQEDAYKQIMEVTLGNTPPLFTDSTKLYKLKGSFLEAGRLFPPVPMMVRDATECVTLPIYGKDKIEEQILLNPGTTIVVDLVAANYNPRHYPEPEEFRPSRWYDVSEEDLPIFSLGPRTCPGKRFALAEAVAFLTLLLQEWKLEIILQDGETRQQWRERVMSGRLGIILGIPKVPLRLVRRQPVGGCN